MSAMTPEELRAECAKLAELAAKATPGPWRAGRELPCMEGTAPYRFVYRSDAETPYSRLKITGGDDDHNDLFDCDADAELIAAAPAAYSVAAQVPALLDRIAQLERDAARYRAIRQLGDFRITLGVVGYTTMPASADDMEVTDRAADEIVELVATMQAQTMERRP